MKTVLRHEAVHNMFGYGFNDQNNFGIYFPDHIDADSVAELAAAQTDLVADVSHIRFTEMLPGRFIPKGREQVLQVSLVDRKRHDEVSARLEPQFNPVGRAWQANYAGTPHEDPNSHLYVVVEGDSQELRDFLVTRPVNLGALAVVSQLNFSVQGPEASAIAKSLPKDFFTSYLDKTSTY